MRIKLIVMPLLFALASYTLVVRSFNGSLSSTTSSSLSTGFESSEGYTPGDVDGQNGWEHAVMPGSWQVETNVKHFGTQAIQSPIGFNDTEARVTTKSFSYLIHYANAA